MLGVRRARKFTCRAGSEGWRWHMTVIRVSNIIPLYHTSKNGVKEGMTLRQGV